MGRELLLLSDAVDAPRIDDVCAVPLWSLRDEPLPMDAHPLRRALRGEHLVNEELLLAGPRRQLVFNSSTVLGRGGAPLAMIVFRDVTELRHLEQMRAEWISLVTHDLRTPLTAVVTRASLLERMLGSKGLATEAAQAAHLITAAIRMKHMTEELLTSTSLEAGGLILDLEATVVEELVASVVEHSVAVEDRQRVSVEHATLLPPVLVDARRIERALANLLANALKYSAAESRVVIRTSTRDDFIVISVIDEGVGIPAEEVSGVFDKFRRSRCARQTRHTEGLGIGLYVVRQIAEAHGGSVRCDSTVGSGSAFHLELPVHRVV
jgi:signal transduction histidine kinase